MLAGKVIDVIALGLLIGQPILWLLVMIDETLITPTSAFATCVGVGIIASSLRGRLMSSTDGD